MKKIIIFTLIALMMSACAESGWKKINEQKIGFAANATGFIDENRGVAVGAMGEVHYTNDGGKDWPRADNVSQCRYAFDALQSGEIFHTGNGGSVGTSTDGGKTWNMMEKPVASKAGLINFYDPQRGCTVTLTNDIRYTLDGGKSWMTMEKPGDAGLIMAIDQYSETGFCFADKKGVLYVSADTGQTWTANPLPVNENAIDLKNLSKNSAALRFTDANNGTVVIVAANNDVNKSKIVVMRTGDGGKTFSTESFASKVNSGSTLFLSPDSALLTVTGAGTIEVYRHLALNH